MIVLTEVLLLVLSVLVALYLWCKHNFSYWRRKNVVYIEPHPIFGNLKEMVTMSASAGDHLKNLYNHKKSKDQPIVGMHIFNKPALLIREPEVIKSILVKDFNKFSNRFSGCDPHGDALGSNNLFFVKNPEWKELRTKLTPVFTSGKMKQMFPLVEEIGRELDKYLNQMKMDAKTNSSVQELKEICALYTTDVIATVAYGLQANSLKNPNGDFRRNGRKIFHFTPWRAVEFSVIFFLPQFVRLLRCKIFSVESSKFLRDTINFVMAERIKHGNTRNDLIDILVAFKKASEASTDQKPLSNDVLVAQAAIFFTAGYETSSSAMSFGLYELSKKPELQNRLRMEIKETLARHNGKVTYEMLNEMEYMNMVIQEVLRLYPPLPFLDRECTLPEGEVEYSLKPYSEFAMPHQMPVYIPIYALQRDPQYFPNPEEFDPERFSPENKANVKPFTYLPFGTGPHNCIGERFGILQTKIGLINFLRNHYVTACEKSHKTMILDPMALIIQSKGGIFCNVLLPIMVLSEWLLLLSGVLALLYFWLQHQYSYWQRKKVPHIRPTFLFGNIKELLFMHASAADQMAELYNHKDARDHPVVGIFMLNKPALLIRDPELIKSILIKNFNYFSDRYSSADPHGDALAYNNLFFIKNPQWKEMRTKLTPVFTSGKLKQMFPLIEEIGGKLDSLLCNLSVDSKTNSCVKELRDISALFTTDVIASVAFGIQANSLKNPDCDFRRNGKPLFTFTSYRAFEFSVIFFLPRFVKLLRSKMFPQAASKFLRDTINYVISERIKSNTSRNDLIDILVAFQKAAENDKDQTSLKVNNDLLVAQAAVFFIAGFETSSSTMSFGLYELSKNPKVQERLRREIQGAFQKNEGKLTYEAINELEYLNMVVQEVLRLYPPLPFLDRECTLPKGETEFSLKPYSDFGVPHGMPIYIPMYGIQRDSKYFPNPEEFNPERFSPENKANLTAGTYIPFGTGPHNCIGERLGILQAKVGLINFLKNHYVTVCDKTHRKMVLEPRALLIQSKGGVYCNLVRDPLLV